MSFSLSGFNDFPAAIVVLSLSLSKRISRPWRLWGNSERCRRTHESETCRYSAALFMSQSGMVAAAGVLDGLGRSTNETLLGDAAIRSHQEEKPPRSKFDFCYSIPI